MINTGEFGVIKCFANHLVNSRYDKTVKLFYAIVNE
jgi:hypothetical protein